MMLVSMLGGVAIQPSGYLAEEPRKQGISTAELARQIEVPVNPITQIIRGERAMTADVAWRLRYWFGTGSLVRVNPEQICELRLAEREVGAEVRKLTSRAARGSN